MKKLKIHFTGIKGVGMTPLAIIAKQAGFGVTGSDIAQEFITDKALKSAGIEVFSEFNQSHINNQDLIVATGAHGGLDNIEVKTAKSKNIQVITQAEAVGEFMKGHLFNKKFIGISVAGAHGKTTTTAMIATLFKEAGLDPSYVIGTGDVGSLGAPGHFGKGNYFIAEADEYITDPLHDKTIKFHWQKPKIIVLTNIEFDHPDVYDSVEKIRDEFLKFVNSLPKDGVLIASGDDPEIKEMLKDYHGRIIKYGTSPENDYIIDRITVSGDQTFFWVTAFSSRLGEFVLKVSGDHNAKNALAAVVAGLEIGLSVEDIKKGLSAFTGSKRRLEYIGELITGGIFYDDYAHHPTEIKTTLATLKKKYPNKKIVCIFQPHTYSRTKNLFIDFSKSFEDAFEVVITDIYASLREEKDDSVTAKFLTDEIMNNTRNVSYQPSLVDVVEYINQKRFRSDVVLVTMGAGDIYKIHSELKFI